MAVPRTSASDAELDVLKALWRAEKGTVRGVRAALGGQGGQWAYTTIQTLLNRLEAKGYVTADRSGMPHVYHPAVTREGLMRFRLRDVAEDLCDGAASPLVMALVRSERFTESEIAEFKQLVENLEPREVQ